MLLDPLQPHLIKLHSLLCSNTDSLKRKYLGPTRYSLRSRLAIRSILVDHALQTKFQAITVPTLDSTVACSENPLNSIIPLALVVVINTKTYRFVECKIILLMQ